MNKQIFGIFIITVFTQCSPVITKNKINYSSNEILTPEIFAAGTICTTSESVFDISFSPTGKTAYFTKRKGNEKQKIMQSNYKNGNWTTPEICTFSTDRDETPFLTGDGKTLYFGSQRPIPNRPTKGNFDMNIWKVEQTANGWSIPTALQDIINQVQETGEEWPSSNENFIFSNDDKNFIYTTMVRGSKSIQIYTTKALNGTFTRPQKISGLFDDEKYWKYSAVYSADGNYLVFNSSGAPGGVGGEDIFIAKKTATGWTKAKGIGSLINTTAEESSPRFSRDGKYFFFSREKRTNPEMDGIWSIYYLETKALKFNELFKN
ncbi:hypothetical protein [Ferruginibacter sp.]